MAADDPNELKSYPITDLLKLERREEAVPNLFFTKGVTTIVAPSGGGKTTALFCVGMYASMGVWGNESIKQRPLFWIAGEDQTGLRVIFEAWMEHNPGCHPDARFVPEAIDFSNPSHTDRLIRHLEGKPRPLIMADALSDILTLGGLDEDRSPHITQVYKNIWRVVNALDACFGVLHHSGWDEKRERGSSAIRGGSDIVAKIVKFDPVAGVVELQHLKRRSGAGPKLDAFYLDAKLISVEGYPQPIPIVTGPTAEAIVPEEPTDADSRNARTLVTIMVQYFPKGAIRADLLKQSGMTESTFYRGHSYAVGNKWLVKQGKLYNLNPDRPWDKTSSKTPSPSPPTSTPLGGVEVKEVNSGTSIGGELEVNWRLEVPSGCIDSDTTANDKNLNQINESESSPQITPGSTPGAPGVVSEKDLAADAIEHLKVKAAKPT